MVEGFNQLTETLKEQDERELAAMSDKLKISLEAASIAHEINQPLSIVRLTAQSLLKGQETADNQPSLRPELIQSLSTLNTEVERIATISNKIRSLLRSTETNLGTVDLLQVIESSVRYVQSNHPHGHWIDITPLQAITAGQAVIKGDGVQLQLALINLLRNALDALISTSPLQNTSPRVAISLTEDDAFWTLAVEDNGPGLNDQLLETLPLNSTKPTGSGLGLFIVRTTAESHGGLLELNPGNSGGVRACLRLPKPQH